MEQIIDNLLTRSHSSKEHVRDLYQALRIRCAYANNRRRVLLVLKCATFSRNYRPRFPNDLGTCRDRNRTRNNVRAVVEEDNFTPSVLTKSEHELTNMYIVR